jgi:BirA family biotin operon repressor/biotin-[acetyl-CoA-carboxylase] ligase
VDELLALLKSAEKPLSGAALGRRLRLSRAAVHKRIEKLRAGGHRITGVNRLGYRLEGEAEGFNAADFRPGWGRPFRHDETTVSTQETAKAAARSGAPEGALFAADRQTEGRGRLGRRWESPAGGLWYSLLLRPPLAPAAVPGLALAAALDWARLLREDHGLDARVKWPNDIWLGERKLAGILTEMSSETDRVHWVVLGVGLNVNNAPPAGVTPAAVSLRAAAGRPLPRRELLAAWMERFSRTYALYRRKGFAGIRRDYLKVSLLTGRRVRYEAADAQASGRVTGVDGEGGLLLRGPEGVVTLRAGDVHLLP